MKKIATQSIREVSWYKKGPGQPLPVPVLGPDLMDPARYAQIFEISHREEPVVPADASEGEEA